MRKNDPLPPVVQFRGIRRRLNSDEIDYDNLQDESVIDSNSSNNIQDPAMVDVAERHSSDDETNKISSGGGIVSFEGGSNGFLSPNNDDDPKRLRRLSAASEVGSFSSGAQDYSNLTIYQVCRTGNVDALKFLLLRKPIKKTINELDNNDLSALHYAAKYNHADCAEVLIKNGAKANILGVDSTTPLHFTAIYRKSNTKPDAKLDASDSNNQSKLIELFSNAGANVNAKDRYGCTALHMASYKGNKAAVIDLLRCNADIECRDETEMTPLHMAASYGFYEISVILIENGALLSPVDQEQSTPLHLAAAGGHYKICEKLLQEAHNRDTSLVPQMLSSVDCASQTPLQAAVDNNRFEAVKVLLKYNAEAFDRNDDTFDYPLHLAAQNGELNMLEIIYTYAKKQTNKSDVEILNVRNKSFQTPLHRAAEYNRETAVQFCLSHGSNIDAQDDDGFTPLLIAASKGHKEVTELLLASKADSAICDNDQKNLLHWVAETESTDFAEKLIQRDDLKELINERDSVGNTPVHIAARNGTSDLVQLLHLQGGDLSLKNEDEKTSLHMAATYGRTKTVKVICELDDDLVGVEDENSNTALHLAALEGHEKVVSLLLEFQADVESRNMAQWTPLDCAASKGWTRTARILLENDAPVDATDKSSITPLYLACENNHPEMVKLLLDWEASLEICCTSNGKNPLDIAIESGSKQCVETILDREDWWNFALENRTAFNDRDKLRVNTPMRKLIRRMPEMAIKAFNNCIIPDKDHAPGDEEFSITFRYEYIDDDYSMNHWLPDFYKSSSDGGSSIGKQTKTTSSDTGSSVGESNVYLEGDVATGKTPHVSDEAQRYTQDTKVLIENHPLTVMVSSQAEHLLQHPLVLMLLHHKWSSFGAIVYYVNLLQFLIYLIFLTGYIVVTKPLHFWMANAENTYDSLKEYIKNASGTGVNYTSFVVFHEVGQWIIILLALFNFCKELFQVKVYKLSYFKSGTNLIELTGFILALFLVIPTAFGTTDHKTPSDPQWQCGAMAIFFSWINLVLFIQKFPKFGIYVVMFTDILITFFKFFVVFFLFVVAFSLGFYALLQNQNEFSTVVYSMVKTGVMMIGEFEYTSIFFEPGVSPEKGSWQTVSMLFFVIFAIIMSIITMNLLVGLAVDDIKAVQDTAVLQRMAMQVELALQVQHVLPEWLQKKFVIKHETIYPNKVGTAKGFIRRLLDSDALDGPAIMRSLNVNQEPIDAIRSRQDRMLVRLKSLEAMIKDMQKGQTQLQMCITKMADKQGIDVNQDDYVGEVADDED